MKISGIHHIQLCIPEGKEAEAKFFYCDILRLKEIAKPDALLKNGGVWFQLGNIELHIGVENLTGEKGKQHPAFLVQDIDSWQNHLTENNIDIQKELPIPGVNRFSIRDPFNNRIEFIEPIS
jgi:catechol 2,3-dioxygenase-like lactoylglutathione lyase family enzyme